MGIVINLFCTWICWKMSKEAFDDGRNGVGWVGIFISALNFAAALSQII